MMNKLAFRNVKRSARDYLVYFMTMAVVTALMFSFHTLLFSEDVRKLFDMANMMAVMTGIATFFIVLIVAWLINYMVRFILEKRSREFGIYLLIGMKKREISRLYIRENVILGMGAFLAGMGLGALLQQILLSVFYSVVQMDYHIHLELNKSCILMTAACFFGCYLLALLRCRRRFKKMNIHDLMESERRNEEISEKHEKQKRMLLPCSIFILALFGVFLFCFKNWDTGILTAFLTGLVLSIYLFYTGAAAWISCYVRKKGNAVYRGDHLFLLRQFSSKVKTMSFLMGTLTALFTLALMGSAVAFMFNHFQNQALADKFPFVNAYLYSHLREFGPDYRKADGTPDMEKINRNDEMVYCDYDTYMGISDYNHLRKMLDLPEIVLKEDAYAIHIKERVWGQTGDFSGQIEVAGPDGRLSFAGYHTESFSQDGHNGGDYILVVPDAVLEGMNPYYAEMAVDIEGNAPADLQSLLDNIEQDTEKVNFQGHVMTEAAADDWEGEELGNSCSGSDSIVVYAAKNLVRDNLVPEIKYMLSSIIFPLFYVGLVFLCVALTVLSVQQLSDSVKYRFRYRVLSQIGYGRKQISRIILKQLLGYYMCPAVMALLISGLVTVYAGNRFNFYTGVHTSSAAYFLMGAALFFGIYAVYFAVTYIGFKRNVERE